MRAGTHGMSDVQWVGCIEAMTPSALKRGISRGVEDLRVLVAQAQAARRRHFLLDALEHVHHDAVGAIADGVNAGLEAGFGGGERHRVDVGFGRGQEAGRRRLVAVRLEQRGAARSERAVGADLDRAHVEVMVAVADDRALGRRTAAARPAASAASRRGASAACRRRSGACRRRPLRRSTPGVVHRGQSEPAALGVGEQDLLVELLRRRRRNEPRHQAHRAIDQDAGRARRRRRESGGRRRIGRGRGELRRRRARACWRARRGRRRASDRPGCPAPRGRARRRSAMRLSAQSF